MTRPMTRKEYELSEYRAEMLVCAIGLLIVGLNISRRQVARIGKMMREKVRAEISKRVLH